MPVADIVSYVSLALSLGALIMASIAVISQNRNASRIIELEKIRFEREEKEKEEQKTKEEEIARNRLLLMLNELKILDEDLDILQKEDSGSYTLNFTRIDYKTTKSFLEEESSSHFPDRHNDDLAGIVSLVNEVIARDYRWDVEKGRDEYRDLVESQKKVRRIREFLEPLLQVSI